MTFTAIGYDGSIDEAGWARLTSFMTVDYAIKAKSDFAARTVTGQRQVTISAGSAYGVGVLSTSDDDVTLDIKTPSSGQFYLVVLRRNWANNKDTLVVLDGPPTGNFTPTDVPSSQPATINHNPGVIDDQPLWWVWANAVTTDLFLFDVRTLTLQSKLAALEGNRFFGSVQDRDRRFPPPASTSDRIALQQAGVDWVRSDTLWTERYYADYDKTRNPNGVANPGWYPVGRGPSFRTLLPGSGAGNLPDQTQLQLLGYNRMGAGTTDGFPSVNRSVGTFQVPIDGWYTIRMGIGLDVSCPWQTTVTKNSTSMPSDGIFYMDENSTGGTASASRLMFASATYRWMFFQRSGGTRSLNTQNPSLTNKNGFAVQWEAPYRPNDN